MFFKDFIPENGQVHRSFYVREFSLSSVGDLLSFSSNPFNLMAGLCRLGNHFGISE
jgi:hypothetical protein